MRKIAIGLLTAMVFAGILLVPVFAEGLRGPETAGAFLEWTAESESILEFIIIGICVITIIVTSTILVIKRNKGKSGKK
ncbi:MAG: hypothetical protein IJS71_01315 [Clostridia bacterium]|nr:hypothetical protein [Clostridia bacterium]